MPLSHRVIVGGLWYLSQLLFFASFDTVLNLDNAVPQYYNTIERRTWFLGYIYTHPIPSCL